MPKSRELAVEISLFIDADHGGKMVNRRNQTGFLIFMNKAPIHWYNKKQHVTETSTFGAEFCSMKVDVVMIEALRCKLRMFGISVD